MKPQDLTIGDRVMYHGKPSVITEIRRTVAEVEWDFDSELVDFGDIKPIPWTAQIAAKNGFTLKGGEYWLQCNNLTIRTGDGYISIVETYKNGFYKEHINLRNIYFNNFQQALRLVGLYELADNLKIYQL